MIEMKANNLTLNPGSNVVKNPQCPRCEETIRELSSKHENRFICGCDKLMKFDIPLVNEDQSGIVQSEESEEDEWPKEWSEIKSNSSGFGDTWMEYGDGLRGYDSTVYANIDCGKVEDNDRDLWMPLDMYIRTVVFKETNGGK